VVITVKLFEAKKQSLTLLRFQFVVLIEWKVTGLVKFWVHSLKCVFFVSILRNSQRKEFRVAKFCQKFEAVFFFWTSLGEKLNFLPFAHLKANLTKKNISSRFSLPTLICVFFLPPSPGKLCRVILLILLIRSFFSSLSRFL